MTDIASDSAAPFDLPIAHAQRGYSPLDANNVNPTWTGFVTAQGQSVRCVVKALSMRQLLNEIFCALTAHATGLPVPSCFLVIADDGEFDNASEIKIDNGKRVYFGSELKGLNSAFVEYKNLTGGAKASSIASWLVGSGRLGEVYAFDEHCANTDRHSGNILLSSDCEVWLIDHGHALTGPDWEKGDLVPDSAFASRLKEWLSPLLQPAQKADAAGQVKTYASSASSVDFGALVSYLQTFGLIGSEDGQALQAFVEKRVGHLPPLVAGSLGYPVGM